jgi:hypothetical protein
VTLETLYGADSNMVNYVEFSDAVNSVFTVKDLERNPTIEPETFCGYENGADPTLNILTVEEEKILESAVTRLKEKVRQRRIDVLTYLEDFDFAHEGIPQFYEFVSYKIIIFYCNCRNHHN